MQFLFDQIQRWTQKTTNLEPNCPLFHIKSIFSCLVFSFFFHLQILLHMPYHWINSKRWFLSSIVPKFSFVLIIPFYWVWQSAMKAAILVASPTSPLYQQHTNLHNTFSNSSFNEDESVINIFLGSLCFPQNLFRLREIWGIHIFLSLRSIGFHWFSWMIAKNTKKNRKKKRERWNGYILNFGASCSWFKDEKLGK